MTAPVTILGIDPGLVKCGWGVITFSGNALSFVACGTIKPTPKLPLYQRIVELHEGLSHLTATYRPTEAAVEESFVSVNGQSTLKLGQARGAILLSLALAGVSVSEYAPRLVKKTVTGVGTADKQQVGAMIGHLLPGAKADSADATDALAIAICHTQHGSGRW